MKLYLYDIHHPMSLHFYYREFIQVYWALKNKVFLMESMLSTYAKKMGQKKLK